MGTPGYVSPEQLRGAPADARSDLFALGAVFYEMLTGQRAFKGATRADTLSAILAHDPPGMTVPGGQVPPSLERLVRRCLEKDPEDRFQSARDVGFALEALVGSASNEAVAVEGRRAPSRRWPRAVAMLAVLAAAAAGGLLAGRQLWQKPAPTFKQLTFRRGWISTGARFAPDGRTVLYAASWDGKPLEIFSTRTDTAESRPLGLPLASSVLSVSSSGQVAILIDPHREGQDSFRGTLAVVPLGGGAPRELAEDVQEADWTPDGRDLCILRWVNRELQMELPPGRVVYQPHNELLFLRMSPTGRHVAFVEYAAEFGPRLGPRLVILDLATKQSRVLVTSPPSNLIGLAWAPGGEELWFTAGHTIGSRDILAVDLSGRQRLVYRSAGVLSLLDISPDGRVLLHRSTDRLGVMARGPDDKTDRDLSVFDDSFLGGFSGDGRILLINEGGGSAAPRGAVYLRRMEGGDPVRIAEGFGSDLSPDGKSVLVKIDDPLRLTEVPVGPGLPRPIDLGGVTLAWPFARWVPPHGGRIVFVGHEAGRPDRVWVVGRSGGTPRPITPESAAESFAISPDGRYVAVSLTQRTVSIVPIDGGEAREIRGLPDLLVARWSGDGRSLFLITRGYWPCQVHRLDLTTERADFWRQVTPADPTGIFDCTYILPSEDGQSYAYTYLRFLTDIIVAEGFK
jgi:Tol biopolymer transport system component